MNKPASIPSILQRALTVVADWVALLDENRKPCKITIHETLEIRVEPPSTPPLLPPDEPPDPERPDPRGYPLWTYFVARRRE